MSNKLSLQQFLPYRCANLAERISLSLSRIYAEQFDITIAEWRTIATLAEHGSLRAKAVGELTNMDKVRVSRAVSSLAARELISRTPSTEDNRATDLALSPQGLALYRRIVPLALEWERELIDGLNQREQNSLFRLLDKLDQRVEELGSRQD